jgi:hypothetical protein
VNQVSAAAPGGHVLAVQRFVVQATGRRRRLLAYASFAGAGALDPGQTGIALAVQAMDGRVLYEATIPGSAFRSNRRRTVFRYAGRPGQAIATANGLRRVMIRLDRDVAEVLAAGTSSDLNAVAAEPALRWALWVGGTCVRDLALTCSAEPAASTSCR